MFFNNITVPGEFGSAALAPFLSNLLPLSPSRLWQSRLSLSLFRFCACLSLVRQSLSHLRPLQACGSRLKWMFGAVTPLIPAPFPSRCCCCPSDEWAPHKSAPELLHFSGWGTKIKQEPVLTSPITVGQWQLWLQGCKLAFYKTSKFNYKPKSPG